MNKKFNALYDFCQTLPIPISRNLICDKAQEIMGQQVAIRVQGLDTTVLRGLFLSGHTNASIVQQHGGNPVIVLARGMAPEWERLVQVKEIMHLFDEEKEMTSTAEQLENLLNSITVPSPVLPPQILSEYEAVYMALACFCPEEERQKFIKQLEAGHSEEYEIALKLRLPQQFVRLLLTPDFLDIIKLICE